MRGSDRAPGDPSDACLALGLLVTHPRKLALHLTPPRTGFRLQIGPPDETERFRISLLASLRNSEHFSLIALLTGVCPLFIRILRIGQER
ncbi:hypothetical protein VTN96DRAFT_1319 [Rasamsonia emersonii]